MVSVEGGEVSSVDEAVTFVVERKVELVKDSAASIDTLTGPGLSTLLRLATGVVRTVGVTATVAIAEVGITVSEGE